MTSRCLVVCFLIAIAFAQTTPKPPLVSTESQEISTSALRFSETNFSTSRPSKFSTDTAIVSNETFQTTRLPEVDNGNDFTTLPTESNKKHNNVDSSSTTTAKSIEISNKDAEFVEVKKVSPDEIQNSALIEATKELQKQQTGLDDPKEDFLQFVVSALGSSIKTKQLSSNGYRRAPMLIRKLISMTPELKNSPTLEKTSSNFLPKKELLQISKPNNDNNNFTSHMKNNKDTYSNPKKQNYLSENIDQERQQIFPPLPAQIDKKVIEEEIFQTKELSRQVDKEEYNHELSGEQDILNGNLKEDQTMKFKLQFPLTPNIHNPFLQQQMKTGSPVDETSHHIRYLQSTRRRKMPEERYHTIHESSESEINTNYPTVKQTQVSQNPQINLNESENSQYRHNPFFQQEFERDFPLYSPPLQKQVFSSTPFRSIPEEKYDRRDRTPTSNYPTVQQAQKNQRRPVYVQDNYNPFIQQKFSIMTDPGTLQRRRTAPRRRIPEKKYDRLDRGNEYEVGSPPSSDYSIVKEMKTLQNRHRTFKNHYPQENQRIPNYNQDSYNPFFQQEIKTDLASVQKQSSPSMIREDIPEEDYDPIEFKKQAESAKYSFASDIRDNINGNLHQRQEIREGSKVTGSYTYEDGFFRRTVHYVADEKGYRVVKEEVDEIGDGPLYNPDGSAKFHAYIAGNNVNYQITNKDISTMKQRHQQTVQNFRSENDWRY